MKAKKTKEINRNFFQHGKIQRFNEQLKLNLNLHNKKKVLSTFRSLPSVIVNDDYNVNKKHIDIKKRNQTNSAQLISFKVAQFNFVFAFVI